ncbi:MAG TPA: glycosyltransferase [Trichormus sp.]
MIFVILPAFNEQLSIEPLFKRLASAAATIEDPMRLVLVDDGSTDDTIVEAERVASALNLELDVKKHSENSGLGRAMKTGLESFLLAAGPNDFACTMDCDDTQPPELLPKMVEMMRNEQLDIVIASRYQPGGKVLGLAAHRVILSHGAGVLFRTLAPIPNVKDYTSGFRMYRYGFLRNLIDRYGDSLFTERGFSCMSDLLLKSRSLNPKIKEIGMILRYHQKPTASKMKIAGTVFDTLKILCRHLQPQ